MSQLIYFVFIGFKNSGGRLELYRVLYSNVPVQVQYFTRCTDTVQRVVYSTVLYSTVPIQVLQHIIV